MDFQLNESQLIFRRNVRSVLEKEYPLSHVKEINNQGLDYDRNFYNLMANLEWLGLILPQAYGGTGGGWMDCAVFYEECGRALIRSPHFSSVVLAGQLIINFASEGQKSNLLPEIGSGKLILACAINEPDSRFDLSSFKTSAIQHGSTYNLTGSKLFIPYANVADYIVTGTKVGNNFGLFLVPSKASGLKCTPMDAIGGEKLCEVLYEDVQLTEDEFLGEKPIGIEAVSSLQNKANLMLCARIIGACEKVLEMTVDYCKQRIIFGKPIGAFQSPQHLMVDMAIAISGLRWIVYHAISMAESGKSCEKEAIMAQLQAGPTYAWLTRNAMHVYGTISLTTEHDLNLFYMESKSTQLNLCNYDELKVSLGSKIGL